jgi:hypothetical protein
MTPKILTKITIRIDAELARLIRHLAVDTNQRLEETCEKLLRRGLEAARTEEKP